MVFFSRSTIGSIPALCELHFVTLEGSSGTCIQEVPTINYSLS